MSLKDRFITGTLWSFAEQTSVKAVNFIVQIVLARLLSPKDFGLIAMMTIVITIGMAIVDGGMTQSLIRTRGANDKDYSTVFYVNIVVSIGVYVAVFFLAPYISQFYNQPLLTNLIRVFTLVIPIVSLMTVQNAILTKEMDFKSQVYIQGPSILLSGGVAVYLAFKGFGVWSLVYMQLLQATLTTIQYWFYSKWRPKLVFAKEKLIDHFGFGYKLMLTTFINALFIEIYNLVIGKFYSPSTLGLYNRAYTFQNLPGFIFDRAITRITYPFFSEMQKDDERLRSTYKNIMLQMMLIFSPIMFFLIFMSKPFIGFVLSEVWLDAAPYLVLLSFAGLTLPLQAYNWNILKAKGKSGLVLKANVISKVLTLIGLFIVIPFGIIPLLVFQAVIAFISLLILTYFAGELINYSTFQQIKDLSPIITACVCVGFGSYFISNQLSQSSQYLLQMIIYLITFIIIYLSIFRLMNYQPLVKLTALIYKRKS